MFNFGKINTVGTCRCADCGTEFKVMEITFFDTDRRLYLCDECFTKREEEYDNNETEN